MHSLAQPISALRPFEKPELQATADSPSLIHRAAKFIHRSMIVGGVAMVVARVMTEFKEVAVVEDAEAAASKLVRDVNFARLLYSVARLGPKRSSATTPRRLLPGVPQHLCDRIDLMNARVSAFGTWRLKNPTAVPLSLERLTRSASTPEYAAAFSDYTIPASIRSAYLDHHVAMMYIMALSLSEIGLLPKQLRAPTITALGNALENALRLGLALPGGACALDYLARSVNHLEPLNLEDEERRWTDYLKTEVRAYGTSDLDQVP